MTIITPPAWRSATLVDLAVGDDNLVVAKWESEKQLALYLRYQTTHDRAFHTRSDGLRKLRNERPKAEIGFASQKRKQAQKQRATKPPKLASGNS